MIILKTPDFNYSIIWRSTNIFNFINNKNNSNNNSSHLFEFLYNTNNNNNNKETNPFFEQIKIKNNDN